MPSPSAFESFISDERGRYETQDNNRFAFAFGEVATYRFMLPVVEHRYRETSSASQATLDLFHIALNDHPSGSPMNERQLALMEAWRVANLRLRMEIETYYLFGTILLDRTAAGISLFFDGSPKRWFRHSRLCDSFESTAAEEGLRLPSDFIRLARSLMNQVSDFRHEGVAHEKTLRAFRAVNYRPGEDARLFLHRLYPQPKDMTQESRPLGELSALIDTYLTTVANLVVTNRSRSALRLVSDLRP